MQWIERSTTIRADWEVAFASLLLFLFLMNCYYKFLCYEIISRLFRNDQTAVR